MLAAVLLHVIEASLPIDIESDTGALLDRCSGVVDVARAYSLDILDVDGFVDSAVIAWLTAALREKD